MSSRRRVLCVDDHEDTCDLVSAILSDSEIVSEHTKADGISRATTERFDLILLDYYLPDGTGLELCRLIRKSDSVTPILLITGTHKIAHKEVLDAGGYGLVPKGDLAQLLPVAVKNAISKESVCYNAITHPK